MPLKYATKRIGKDPKKKQIDRLIAQLKEASSLVIADVSRLLVSEMRDLRSKMREKGARVIVAKNRLMKRALEAAGYAPLDRVLQGPSTVFFGISDPGAPARILSEFSQESEKVRIKGGALEREALDAAGAKALASMPGRPELLGRLVGSLNAPQQKLVFALHQTQGKIVYALDAYRRKLEEQVQSAALFPAKRGSEASARFCASTGIGEEPVVSTPRPITWEREKSACGFFAFA